MTESLTIFFTCIGLAISLCVWLIIGLMLWLGLLMRHFCALAFMSIFAAFGRVDMTKSISSMQAAVSFYPNGFMRIIKSFSDLDPNDKNEELWPTFGKFILGTYASALSFWLPIAMITKNIAIVSYVNVLFIPFIFAWHILEQGWFWLHSIVIGYFH